MRNLMILLVAAFSTACSTSPTTDNGGGSTTAPGGNGITSGDYDPGADANATLEISAYIDGEATSCSVLLDGLNAGETGDSIAVASGDYDLNLGTYQQETWDGLPVHVIDGTTYVAPTLDLTVTSGESAVVDVHLNPYFDFEGGADCHLVTGGDGWEEDYPLDERFALEDGYVIDADDFIGGTIEFIDGIPYLYGPSSETHGTNEVTDFQVTATTLTIGVPGFGGTDVFTCTAR